MDEVKGRVTKSMSIYGTQVGSLADGTPVVADEKSHLHTEYLDIHRLLESLCSYVTPLTDEITYTHDFGDVLGESICVETKEGDDILYAMRLGREGFTRFVKGIQPRPTSKATIALRRDSVSKVSKYTLVTVYLGEEAPPEPWDIRATSQSLPFWCTHALVWGVVPIVPGSETKVCPW